MKVNDFAVLSFKLELETENIQKISNHFKKLERDRDLVYPFRTPEVKNLNK